MNKKNEIAQLQEKVTTLQFALQELSVLNELAMAASHIINVDEMLDTIVKKSVAAVHAEQGAILLLSDEKETPELKTLIRHEDRESRLLKYKVGANLTGWVLRHKKPLKVDHLGTDPRFKSSAREPGEIRSVLAIPIRFRGNMLGVLTVTNKKTAPAFSDNDLRLLTIIAAQSGQLIRNSQLQQEALEQKKKELENQRLINKRLVELDRLKDEFLANTSHELRTPLNGIIGLAEGLVDSLGENAGAEVRENLGMIITSGKRLASLVNDILDFSRLKNHTISLQKKSLGLRGLTEVMLKLNEPLLSGKNIRLINQVDPQLPPVEADENRLQQILHNLIGNAIKFTDSGEITIAASVAEPREDGAAMLRISVSDTGIGIPPEKRESIFQSFEQADASISRSHGGTGLGLSITRQLVELHGGKIWVDAKEGEGSTFHFTLPVSQREAEPLQAHFPPLSRTFPESSVRSGHPQPGDAPPGETPADGVFRILVVDDEPVNQQVLKNHLQHLQYHVTQAYRGAEALAVLEQQPRFDLVLLDIMMPEMSGYEVCQKIRERYLPSELPVIMITAKDRVSDLVEGFSAGANDYLAKPISKSELLARIKTHLSLYHINTAYGRFVPREFLQSLGKESIVDVRLGDHVSGKMTILFSDIRSYSTLSETMTPEENFKFLNAYYRRVGPCISRNGGFVSQYYGDGLMALFLNNPLDAIHAGIEMQQVVHTYNEARRKREWAPIRIGVGLHTGPLMIGIIGDAERMNAGVVSDAVNTAARMEGLTKFYGAPIVISADTLTQIEGAGNYHHRFLGKVQVKGKTQPVPVYEVTDGDRPEIMALKMQTKTDFEEGLSLYFAKKFEYSSVCFRKVLDVNPHDLAARLYLKRSAQYMVEGVDNHWSGIEVFTMS